MLCEKCNKFEASVHTVAIVNGEKREHHFCAECAKSNVQYSLPSIMNLLSGFYRMPQKATEVCACGGSFERFQKTGLLGCPLCYTNYREHLLPVIKRAQGGRIRHVGRRPVEYSELVQAAEQAIKEQTTELTVEEECHRLRRELQEAVGQELYERAAELRDRIRMLEGGKDA